MKNRITFENGVVLTDKYGFGIVDVTEDKNGYKYVRSNFEYEDKHSDNIDFVMLFSSISQVPRSV